MAGKVPLKRKLEIAVAGYLIDRQKADPGFLPGHTIVCGSTGRSPDAPPAAPGDNKPVEPDLPYTSVGCQQARESADFPSGFGMMEASVVVYCKTHAADESRACADEREASVAALFEDADALVAALNMPANPAAADTRRQKDLYLYTLMDLELNDGHTDTTWEDQIVAKVICHNFDPARG